MDSGMISRFSNLVSCESKMLEIFGLLEKVAPSDATILLLGESGTGKDLMAKAIHEKSHRSARPFVAVNCAAVPEDLIESELFGHVKGAFTGAVQNIDGKFEQANGGTLFLDEIGDMSFKMQTKILRALENREIQPVGSNRVVKVDVRVVAATNKLIAQAVEKKEFRNDLFYRLNEFSIDIPPLRERPNDLHLIMWDMVEEYNREFKKAVDGISLPALGILQNHSWPGNIRELRNVIKRLMLLISPSTSQIYVEHLPVQLVTDSVHDRMEKKFFSESSPLFQDFQGKGELGPDLLPPLDDIEKRYIEYVLDKTDGNKSKAARILGIDRTTLYEKIKKHGIGSPKQ